VGDCVGFHRWRRFGFIDGSAGSQLFTAGSGIATIWGGAGDTVVGGSGQILIGFGAGPEFFSDTGTAGGNASVYAFSQSAGDRILLNGLESTNSVLASATTSNGNTAIAFADGSKLTLLGISHIDSSFFA
jgi:hypothetical protein